MNSKEIRQRYIEFFKAKDHAEINSSSLIPENDPSLLFTNSGMSPLVPYLLGEKHPKGKRLINSQKCFRAEDIEEIGDNRHNTFFEMLGNWSFGDYFKKEQLNWYFHWLADDLGIDPEKLYFTIYAGNEKILKDQESAEIIKEIFKNIGINAEEGDPDKESDFSKHKIFAYTEKNWWQRGDAIGELGGPDSEVFYDTSREHDSKFGAHCHPNCGCGRFIEIGNSVFMQYQKTEDGWKELKNKNVDFGGGLERTAMVLQNKDNIFETDLFINIIKKIEELSGKKYKENIKCFEVIADHLKAATFIMGDDKGIAPSNTDQGYVVRRLIRRAIRYARQLGISKKNWISEIAKTVINDYQDVYPELKNNQDFVFSNLTEEEAKFEKTLERGLKEFSKLCDNISGKKAFDLYQTYGFPIEMTQELAEEKGMMVDKNSFNAELKKHQELSRTASAHKFQGGLADHSEQTTKLHTATHLLLSALRKVLGNHVYQKGSNITADRLRFDFSNSDKLANEQIQEIENLVNQAIKDKLSVSCEEMLLSKAKEIGAIGVFESKYDDMVKVFAINGFSKEICNGPHVENTGDLGVFKIKKEQSSSAGIRRIKAVLE
ncbi:MAG: alanine--tRNA ligase [bacterium]